MVGLHHTTFINGSYFSNKASLKENLVGFAQK